MTTASIVPRVRATNLSRAVIDNAPAILLFLAGGLTGALLLLMSGVIDVQNDALKFLLGSIPALLGAAVGLAAGRALDRVKDRRDIGRKARLLSFQIRNLGKGWKANLELLAEITIDGTQNTSADGTSLTREQVGRILITAERLRRAASAIPSFSDVLECDEDAEHAENVGNLYAFTASHYPLIAPQSKDEARRAAATLSTIELFNLALVAVHTLEEAELYFRDRAYT